MAAGVLEGKRLRKELARLEAMTQYEKEYEAYAYVYGIDEAGREPLAGPVVAGAVILPKGCWILYLNDFKKLSRKQREELFKEIKKKAAAWSAGIMSPAGIDEINIPQATYEAMRDAVGRLGVTPDVPLNDAVTVPSLPMKQVPIIEEDTKSLSIAAAGVLAKVMRDRVMAEYEEMFPDYGLTRHKGYGTAAHIQAIRELGPYPIHRRSFIRNFVEQENE